MRAFAFLLGVLTGSIPAPSGETLEHPHAEALSVLDDEARAAFVILRDADAFTSERDSGYVEAVRALMGDPHAQLAFGSLWQSENRVARLYALAGFWYLRPGEFRAALESLRGDETPITTHAGCMTFRTTVDTVLDGADAVPPVVPSTSLYEAFCNNLGLTADDLNGATMTTGYLAMILIEGHDFDCRRPDADWPRLHPPTAWSDAGTESLLQLQRARAVPPRLLTSSHSQ